MKKVSVIGLGYIGLPTAIIAAQSGLNVVGIDIDKKRVDAINQGAPTIEEPSIIENLKKALDTKLFKASQVYEEADYFIIAVPTPFTTEKKADLSYVFAALTSIATVLKKGDTVILESTVPVGTTSIIADFLSEKTDLEIGLDFFVAHCPERVLPGNIFQELRVNDRIIGGVDRGSTKHVATFYKYFVSGDMYLTDSKTAEMIKLVENSYRDINIAISHQISSMAYNVGIDPYDVIELANKHPRVNLLNPTVGVGGHCLAVDPYFLIESFPDHTELLSAARNVNDNKPKEILSSIEKHTLLWEEKNNKKAKILLLGLAYKPNVDDLRESPALYIAREFTYKFGKNSMICDPYIDASVLEKNITKYKVDLNSGIEKADIIVCLVGHKQFKSLDKSLLVHKKVLDFTGLLHITRKRCVEQEQFYWPTDGNQGVIKKDLLRTDLYSNGGTEGQL